MVTQNRETPGNDKKRRGKMSRDKRYMVDFLRSFTSINANAIAILSLRGGERRSNPMKSEIAAPIGSQ